MNISTVTAVAGTAIAAATLASAAWQHRRSVYMGIFRTYADHYNSIITPAVYHDWKLALAGDEERWMRMTQTMLAYLNLAWEEIYLTDCRVIPAPLWRIWCPELHQILTSKFAQHIMNEYNFHFPTRLWDQLTPRAAR